MRKFQIKSLSADEDASEEVKAMAGELATIASSLAEGDSLRILEDILPTAPPTKSEGKEGRESPEGPAKSVSAAELFHEAATQSPEITRKQLTQSDEARRGC